MTTPTIARRALVLGVIALHAAALSGCDWIDNLLGQPTKAQRNGVTIATQQEMRAHTEAVLGFLAETPVAPTPEPVAVIPEPEPVWEYDLYNADPAGYVCTAMFRSLSCLDDGRPVYLDNQMAQLPFGTHP